MSKPARPSMTDENTQVPPASSRPQPSRRLIASLSDDRIAVFPLSDRGRFTIGRGSAADWLVSDSTISRLHAAITVDESVAIEDLRSRNGVSIGERRIGS